MALLNNNDLCLLQILRCDEVFKKALRAVAKGAELFPIQHVPHLTCIWNSYLSSLKTCKQNKTKFSKDTFVALVLQNMKKYDLLPENKQKLKDILERYQTDEEPVDIKVASNLLKQVVTTSVQRKLSMAVVTSSAYESIKQIVEKGNEIEAEINNDTEKGALFINPLLQASKFLKLIPKKPTGVLQFDTVTHGGMSPGEVCLIAGLSGGGKSMTTIQIVGTQLLVNKSVAWFTYEQPFDQDLMQRLVAFITGYSLDKIRNTEFEDLPENVQQKYNTLTSTMQERLAATDFSSEDMLDKDDELDDGSVYSIRKRLELAKEAGVNFDYVVVDWLGAAVKRIAAVRNVDIGIVTKFIEIASTFLTDLVKIAKDFNVPIIIFHQLDPKLKSSPPSRKPSSNELQMIKSANNWVQYAITIGKLDENHRCWFICDKNRTGYPAECVIEMDGEHARFKMLRGYAPGRNGQFVNMAEIEQQQGGSNEQTVEQSYAGLF